MLVHQDRALDLATWRLGPRTRAGSGPTLLTGAVVMMASRASEMIRKSSMAIRGSPTTYFDSHGAGRTQDGHGCN